MAAVPKRKISRTRRNKRRTHWKLRAATITSCSNCGQPARPHRVCKSCGYYRGRAYLEPSD